jgi:hypothetical protein
MTLLRPAPEGQPTSSIQRMRDHSAEEITEWEGVLAQAKRTQAVAERAIAREQSNVKLYEYQLSLREAEGRVD